MAESKYHVKIPVNEKNAKDGFIHVDWYMMVRCKEKQTGIRKDPAIEHADKKLWAPGERGSKTLLEDIIEARNQLNKFISYEENKGK